MTQGEFRVLSFAPFLPLPFPIPRFPCTFQPTRVPSFVVSSFLRYFSFVPLALALFRPFLPETFPFLVFPNPLPSPSLASSSLGPHLPCDFLFFPLSHHMHLVIASCSPHFRDHSPSSDTSLHLHFLSRSQSSPFPHFSTPSRPSEGERTEERTGT